MGNVFRYRTEFYNAVFALLQKVRSAAIAASRTLRDVLMKQVSGSDFQKMVIFQELIATAVDTLFFFKKDTEKVAKTRLGDLCF